jgi:1-deoxy-D-xylulose-5-phosphate reductoisomerase
MKKDIFILGSTGSIGQTTLNIIKNDKKKFCVKLLTTNKNINKIYKQAKEFNVKKIVVFDKDSYLKCIKKFKNSKIKVYNKIEEILKVIKKKSFLTVNAISGIEGLDPTLKIIKHSNILAIANKESIICGWQFINKELKKNNTEFIPLDSEHFSIWSLLKYEKKNNINKVYITASGGPFLNRNLQKIKYIKSKYALKHPNWKMGKKISIDSATMMNKIFEIIEAMKIFDLTINKFEILIHPQSYLHAIINFKNGITKLLAHQTSMEVPIANSIYSKFGNYVLDKSSFDHTKINGSVFMKPNKKNFPLLQILKYKFSGTYFETILVSLNDRLVKEYLDDKISYITIHKKLIKLLKTPYFTKYYSKKPKDINDIKNMVIKVNLYLDEYLQPYKYI